MSPLLLWPLLHLSPDLRPILTGVVKEVGVVAMEVMEEDMEVTEEDMAATEGTAAMEVMAVNVVAGADKN